MVAKVNDDLLDALFPHFVGADPDGRQLAKKARAHFMSIARKAHTDYAAAITSLHKDKPVAEQAPAVGTADHATDAEV